MHAQKRLTKYSVVFLLALALFTPAAYALRSGFSPLDRGVEMISDLFNIRVLQTSAVVQEGFLKFMLFIVIFAVTFAALKAVGKIFDQKTAGIVSFAFSMIGVFLMPTTWLLATGGLVTAVVSSLVFLLVFWGGAYYAVFKMKGDDSGGTGGWIKNLMGFFLILLLFIILTYWAEFTHLSLVLLMPWKWLERMMGR